VKPVIDRTLPKVVFLGTHGQHNIGDELLLETFLHQFGPNAHYVINTYDTGFTEAQLRGRYSFELIDTAGGKASLLRHLWGADRVVFGGGSIVKELYSTTGRNRYATLLMVLAIALFVRRVARRPVSMFNIGVGPITTPMGKRLARLILRQMDLVTVRDRGSLDLCQSLGVDVELATDAVFSLSPEWFLGEQPATERRPGPLRMALNLNYDIENPDNWDHFTSHLAEGLRRLAATHPLEIHVLPMQSRFKDHDDASVLRSFADSVPEIRFVHHAPTTPGDAARIIADCDLVISERLHAIVMASILSVPAFVLAYDVKVRELSSALALDDYTVDINQPFALEELEGALAAVVDDLGSVQQRLALPVSALRRRAEEAFASAREWTVPGTNPIAVTDEAAAASAWGR
jgi:polysaccharide pyruvyl transferase CsaB